MSHYYAAFEKRVKYSGQDFLIQLVDTAGQVPSLLFCYGSTNAHTVLGHFNLFSCFTGENCNRIGSVGWHTS